ncbi:MAG: hypothetical protein RMA76_31800 [Deltaproteobacteria bacterium]|jgi:hypothetical protein
MKLEQPFVDALAQSIRSPGRAVEISPELYAEFVRSIAASDVDVDALAREVEAQRWPARTLSFDLKTTDDVHVGFGHDLDDLVDAVKAEGKVKIDVTESPADARGQHAIVLELRGAVSDVKAVEGRIADLARGVARFQAS